MAFGALRGTGKTYLGFLFLASIKSQIYIAVDRTIIGIAATLLDSGQTAHSALKLTQSIHITDTPMCAVLEKTGIGECIQLLCGLNMWTAFTIEEYWKHLICS